ncbi:MAG TPA: helix-turn-helix domain-containing protein [Thermoplasmata archaeon]|nr:helix-turn-helix domain-containing protein [Thermoplasmata archaeon]
MQDLGTRWGAGVRLHVCRRADGAPRQLLQLLEITSTAEDIPAIAAFLRDRRETRSLSLTQLGPHRLLAHVVTPLPALCHSVFEMGAICMTCPFLPNEEARSAEAAGESDWRVLVHRSRDAAPLLASYSAPGDLPASLVRIGSYGGAQDLTPHQERAVAVAFALGYFDYPRRAQLGDVARSLGVSRAAAMENLRRGLRKLASHRQSEVGGVRPVLGADRRPRTSSEESGPSGAGA